MSVAEVVEQFRKLPREEQREVFEVLRARFANEPSPEQLAEFERRAESLRHNPETGIPWEQVRAELKERLAARRACPVK
jgi:putative addiction module component (TIGR02574 family)